MAYRFFIIIIAFKALKKLTIKNTKQVINAIVANSFVFVYLLDLADYLSLYDTLRIIIYDLSDKAKGKFLLFL